MRPKHVKTESAEEDDPVYKEPPMAFTLGWWHRMTSEWNKSSMEDEESLPKQSEEQHQSDVVTEKKKSKSKPKVAKRTPRKKI